MNLKNLMKNHRREELLAVFKFISTCDLIELTQIVEEIRCVHDNLMAFNFETGLLAKIESVYLNGECIQLNIEKDEGNEPT